jgi:creatinine amidohydrolase/Fe(II)-dependent formamide hydrolase-like protein
MIRIPLPVLGFLVVALVPGDSSSQEIVVPGVSERAATPDPSATRPIGAYESVFIEELTWMEVRDAFRAGHTTVIVPTGGVEQNGPYLPTGKHNYVLRRTAEAIARRLGHTLVAPIVPFVPEGSIAPPSEHMLYPGTISVTEETFVSLLKDIANSLRAHGFQAVVFIGDSGGNQAGMGRAARELAEAWKPGSASAHFIPEYYDNPRVTRWLQAQGRHEVEEGIHDNLQYTSQLMTLGPDYVRWAQRRAVGRDSINGIPLTPTEPIVALGWRLIDHQAQVTAEAIKKSIASSRRSSGRN